ncbi:MAG: peptide chain release factor 2 [Elusimicrobiota bacterium]
MDIDLKETFKKLKKEIDKIRGRFDIDAKRKKLLELQDKSFEPGFWDDQITAQKIMQDINNLKIDVEKWDKLSNELKNEEEMFILGLEENDEKVVLDIQKSVTGLEKNINDFSFQAKLSGKFDKNNAIVTLHSGAGGTEACDWVDMLFRMYRRWAERRNYNTEILDILPGEEAGIKSVTFIVNGRYSYGYLKAEIGIHRLVRISPFDANKRRHTSFASCDVLPEINDDIEINIDEKDLKIDTYRSGGAGGQHVNKTESAVRITHMPTGAVVQCQNERSQHKNKATAMKLLKAKLYDLEQEKQRKESEKHYDDKGQIAWGSQIRSYVFCPYTMVKDHRTNTEIGNVQAVMDGEIDSFIDAFLTKS